jgi:hypothetical protein
MLSRAQLEEMPLGDIFITMTTSFVLATTLAAVYKIASPRCAPALVGRACVDQRLRGAGRMTASSRGR